jgi:hypothetical protein
MTVNERLPINDKFFSTAKSFMQTASLITNSKFITFFLADDRDIPHLKFDSSLFYENLLLGYDVE